MGALADALAIGPEFTFKGKTYRAAKLAIKHRGMFELRLEKEAWDAIERSRAFSTPEQIKERIAVLIRDLASFQLSYGSEAYVKATRSLQGHQYSLYLAVRENHPEIDEGLIAEMFEERMEQAVALHDQVDGETGGERTSATDLPAGQ